MRVPDANASETPEAAAKSAPFHPPSLAKDRRKNPTATKSEAASGHGEARGEGAEERDARGADKHREDARAEEPVRIPDKRERGVQDGHDRGLGVEEVPVRRLPFGHKPRRVEIPSLVLIERAHPHRREREHGEAEGRQKPISLH